MTPSQPYEARWTITALTDRIYRSKSPSHACADHPFPNRSNFMNDRDDEIEAIMAEEKSRGTRRKRLDTVERSKARETRAALAKALSLGDERILMKILREVGLKDDSPEFVKALQLFRDLASRR